MRRILLSTMILLAFSAWVVAQQEPNSQSPPPATQGTQSSAGQNSVEGCLGGSGANYTVTNNAGTTYQLQLPPGANAAALKPHVGEEVRVEGDMAGASGSSRSAGRSSGGQHTIAVKNIYRISSTCNTKGPGGPPKGH